MRKIEYIFIDSDGQCKPDRHALPNFGYHFVVNSQGLVTRPTNLDIPAKLIQGPIYDRDKYNKCSVSIRYCGSLKRETCNLKQRALLISLLVELRKHFPDAKILGVSELDGKKLYDKNIIVSDSMNLLRRELSEQ